MQETTITIPTSDGLELFVYRWAPEGAPRAVVQVQHGLAEHGARYRRFAEALTAAGYLVYAPDSRGAGRSAKGDYGNWGPDNWVGWVNDLGLLNARISADNPGLPIALLGHSMGSFATQQYLLDNSGSVDAAILSGSTDVAGLVDVLGSPEPADLSSFNAGFEPRTGFEWLSRDEAEVDKYVADPECGWVAQPFVGLDTLRAASDPEQVARVRPDLPIFVLSGDRDPVAGPDAVGPQVVAQRYRDVGVQDVTLTLYPEARHEVLNETNRDEVTADILAFLDRTVGAA